MTRSRYADRRHGRQPSDGGSFDQSTVIAPRAIRIRAGGTAVAAAEARDRST